MKKLVLLFVLVVMGCGDDDPIDGRCRFIEPAGQPDDRTIVIGTLRSGPEPIEERFTPWTDGSDQELVFGFQGGWMLQPTIRISALPEDPDGLCATLNLRNESTASVESGVEVARELVHLGDWHYIGPIDDLLNFESEPLIGQDITLEATVTSDLFMSGDTVTVTMVPAE